MEKEKTFQENNNRCDDLILNTLGSFPEVPTPEAEKKGLDESSLLRIQSLLEEYVDSSLLFSYAMDGSPVILFFANSVKDHNALFSLAKDFIEKTETRDRIRYENSLEDEIDNE